jgi:acetolactate synthase regulatory subunit
MSSLPIAAASDADATHSLPTVCFSVQARPEPGVMPRVVELFAKRGLVPRRWHSNASPAALNIEVHMPLDRDLADYMAACMRQIIGVETVLTSEARPLS